MTWIARKSALALLRARFPDIDFTEKLLENWTRGGGECREVRSSTRIGYEEADFFTWLDVLADGIVRLDKADYARCFEFAVRSFYERVTKADFNRQKQRDVGEFMTNIIQGKLGEIAFERLMARFALGIRLDFRVDGDIPSQDITEVSTRPRVWDTPKARVSIKTTKFKNVLLAISENEAKLQDRKSDLYILTQVGLFNDHLLRALKDAEWSQMLEVEYLVPDFVTIPARVAGWITFDGLIAGGLLSPVDIKDRYAVNMASNNYIRVPGDLGRNWQSLKDAIVNGLEKD